MTNPKLFGYEQLLVEARSDAAEPFFLLPLHRKVPITDAVADTLRSDCSGGREDRLLPRGKTEASSSSSLGCSLKSDTGKILPNKVSRASMNGCRPGPSAFAVGRNGFSDIVSATADGSVFIPSIGGPETDVSVERTKYL